MFGSEALKSLVILIIYTGKKVISDKDLHNEFNKMHEIKKIFEDCT